jgi:molybdate transport system substrate-binding protein
MIQSGITISGSIMRPTIPLLILALLLSACGPDSPRLASQSLRVFAAASLNDAFSEIGQAFETSHPGSKVQFNFAGSNTLRAQIEQGASPDVFASANTKEMTSLIAAGFVQQPDQKIFLTNKLVIVVPKGNPAGIQSPSDLARTGVKIVLAAAEVPAGRYARQALEQLNAAYGENYSAQVMDNVVSNETDVRQALAKVQLGEVDAGIVYTSDAVAAPEVGQIAIPDPYNIRAEYPIAPLVHAPNPELARQFVDFVLSPAGKSILEKWGFTPP